MSKFSKWKLFALGVISFLGVSLGTASLIVNFQTSNKVSHSTPIQTKETPKDLVLPKTIPNDPDAPKPILPPQQNPGSQVSPVQPSDGNSDENGNGNSQLAN